MNGLRGTWDNLYYCGEKVILLLSMPLFSSRFQNVATVVLVGIKKNLEKLSCPRWMVAVTRRVIVALIFVGYYVLVWSFVWMWMNFLF